MEVQANLESVPMEENIAPELTLARRRHAVMSGIDYILALLQRSSNLQQRLGSKFAGRDRRYNRFSLA